MSLECTGYQHAFDNKLKRDRHRNPSSLVASWNLCKHYLCPNRYQRIQVEVRLGGKNTSCRQSQEEKVRTLYPNIEYPDILPGPQRTPSGSPTTTSSKKSFGDFSKPPEDPQEPEEEEQEEELEEEEEETPEDQESSSENKGKNQEQEPKGESMDTGKPEQLHEAEYRFRWKGQEYYGLINPEEDDAFRKEIRRRGIETSGKEEYEELEKHLFQNIHQYPYADRWAHRGVGKFGRPADSTPTPAQSASAAFGSLIPGLQTFTPNPFALSTSTPQKPPVENPKDDPGDGDSDPGEDRDTGGSRGGNGGDGTPTPGRGEPGGPGGGGPGGPGGPGGGGPGGPQYYAVPNAQPQRGKVKIKEPDIFNGDRNKLEGFLDQLFLVFMGDTEKYATDKAKVAYALSYLGDGEIKYWKKHQVDQIRNDPRNMPTWQNFEALLRTSYTPLNQTDNALLDLEELSLEDFDDIHAFNAQFNMLIKYSRVTDGQICMSYYRNALPSWLRKKISTSFPVPTDIIAWIGRATDIYEQDLINRKIDGNLRRRRPRRKTTQTKVRRNIHDSSEQPDTGTDASANANVNKMTMQERSRHLQQNLCFFCHKPGHQAKECPNRAKGGKPGRRVNRKVRQIVPEDSETGGGEDGNNSEKSTDEQSEDDEYQVDAIQQDFDPEETDF